MKILQYVIASVMIVDGIDKYFNVIADWKDYLAIEIIDLINISSEEFLGILGIVEIIIGVIFLFKAHIGGLLVAVLMAGISFNLLLMGEHYNLVLQNTIVGLAALTVAQFLAKTPPLPK